MTRPSAAALRVLRDTFGHPEFRPGQEDIVSTIAAGRDVVAVLPTGAGKSICFQVPALLDERPTLVVSPLIALMRDQVEGLRARGVRAVALTSESTGADRELARRYLVEPDSALVYVSPERLSTNRFRSLVPAGALGRIVVDEAHCISEWGHDFRPAYRQIASFASGAGRPPIAAFTATATPETRSDIRRQLGLTNAREFIQPVDRPNLHWSVARCPSPASAFEALRLQLRRTGRGASIVYAHTRAQTIAIAAAARRSGHPAEAYHAGLSAERKRQLQQAFMSTRDPIIVATCAFGMGIDHPHVRLVCHIGAPGALETYVQEAGRAGRDGEPARCVLVATPEDSRLHRARLREMPRPARHWARRRLQAMEAYADESECRRAAVSRYFGQSAPACRGCDLCDGRRAPGNLRRPVRVHTLSGIQ